MRRVTMKLCAALLTPFAMASYAVLGLVAAAYGCYRGVIETLEDLSDD